MTVHAHPDDEASKGPGTIALYSSRGVSTVLVCCTGGEEGDLQNPALAEAGGPLHGLKGSALSQAIADMRPAELAASAQAIGFDHVVMLGYRDSGMAGCDANTHPDCFATAPHDDACRRLVTEIRRHRPDVLLTYPDDQRGYPHPDHLRVHEISMAAVEHAADPAWYPDTGPAHEVRKVYYSAWSRRRLLALHDALLKKWGESPFDERWWERPDTDHRITTRIDVADHMAARSAALRAHATQIDPASPFWFGLDDVELRAVYPFEDWILARPSCDEGAAEEVDFFAGLDDVRCDADGQYFRAAGAPAS